MRRRRAAALAALVALAAATGVLVAALLEGSSGSSPARGAGSADGPQAPPREAKPSGAPGRVRNASPQPDWRPYTGPVPILEYHVLGPAPADAPYPELYVTRPDFHRQMGWLEDHGYEAVTLETVERAWHEDGTLPPKPVVLQFDDGYRPDFTYALPELRRHDWPGVLNLKAEGSDLYTSNVEAMIDAGWELAAHTIDHRDLTTLGTAELEREVTGSRRLLRREFQVPVRNFCYPAGRFDPTVIAAVEAAGYAGATTEVPGFAERDKPFELDRFEILGSTGVGGVAEDLG